jgi:two-component system, chemotaxis family, protein-glutamate methylesterase/glutaminase
VPTLVVQHMPPIFTTVFAEHLQGQLGVPAREARDGEAPVAGQIYVAPGGRHLGLVRDKLHKVVLRVDDGPAVNFCRPAVDILFRDAAAVFGASALAVVLTGMGSDGLAGAKALAATGAAVIAQDEATSTVWGMPGHVARGGFAEEILPLEGIAASIRQRLGVGR